MVVTRAFRAEFDARNSASKVACPAVEVINSFLFQRWEVEIPLHCKNFVERVANRRARRENHTAAVTHFRQQFRLEVHVPRACGIRRADTNCLRLSLCAIGEVRHKAQILEHVRLVDKDLVNAELLERHDNFAAHCLHVSFQFCLEMIYRELQLFFKAFGACFPARTFPQFALQKVKLFLNKGFLCFGRDRQSLKQVVRNDYPVPIARCYLR